MIDRNMILEHVTDEGQGFLAIWKKIGMWSEIAIRNHLVAMCEEGLIERYKRSISHDGSQFQWMYRRKPENPND